MKSVVASDKYALTEGSPISYPVQELRSNATVALSRASTTLTYVVKPVADRVTEEAIKGGRLAKVNTKVAGTKDQIATAATRTTTTTTTRMMTMA